MAENKQYDIVNQLSAYKSGNLNGLQSSISHEKARLTALITSINAKREDLIEKEQENLAAEAEKSQPVVEVTASVSVDENMPEKGASDLVAKDEIIAQKSDEKSKIEAETAPSVVDEKPEAATEPKAEAKKVDATENAPKAEAKADAAKDVADKGAKTENAKTENAPKAEAKADALEKDENDVKNESAAAKEKDTAKAEDVKNDDIQKQDIKADDKKADNIKAEDKKPEDKKPDDKKAGVAKSDDKKPKANAKDEAQQSDKTATAPQPKVTRISADGRQETTAEILPNGEVRRIYIPPTPAPKKPRVQTRVFEPGYNPRQRPQGPRPTGAPTYNRVGSAPAIPQNFPPTAKPNTSTVKRGNNKKSAADEKAALNKRALYKKGYIVDNRIALDDDDVSHFRKVKHNNSQGQNGDDMRVDTAIITTELVPIKVLSSKIGRTGAEIIKKLFLLGIIKTINESIDFETAELVSGEFDVKLEYKPELTQEDTLSAQEISDDVDELDKLKSRPPIITIMGHVDHGKTSLLDYIRKANVASGEAGGITQAIGAYTISLNGSPITFLDTPGHEAFTAMRARGSQVTDIAVLVVAADDGIMPQTIESINHAKNAKVPIIVAINKMDKPGANPDRVLQQLTEYNLVSEEWGGETPVCKVSAKTGDGVQNLLENILTMAEVLELKANPDRSARGSIIEARLDKGKGPIATILVQKGTLKVGDVVVAGTCCGKIKSMVDDKGRKTTSAGPSIPVSVSGFAEVPEAGDPIIVVSDEKFAKDLSTERKNKLNRNEVATTSVNLADIFAKIKAGELKSLELIIKADVQGSVEAVCQSLAKLGNEEVKIEIIHNGVGAITENDVNLAATAGAIIIGFNVRPDTKAKTLADQEKVDIRCYSIIYNAIEDIEKAVKGMLAPKFEENILGQAEIREVFHITGAGVVAGCHVTSGKIVRGAKARLVRDGAVLATSEIASLKHNKDDAKEIKEGFDCGLQLQNYSDVKQGDVIEAFSMEEIAQ